MMMSKLGLLLVIGLTASCGLDIDVLDGHDSQSEVTYHGPDAGRAADAPPKVAPAPILHYTFDDTLDNAGSLGAGYAGHGTGYSFDAGKVGTAIQFDKTRESGVVLPTQVPLSSDVAYTIGFWFREDSVWNSDPYTQYLFDSRGNGGFQTYHGAGGNESLTTCSAAGCQGLGYAVGVWHHLIYRYDGANGDAPLELFIDGKLAATLPASDVYFSTTQKSVVIGTRTNMMIDDLRVYDAALSDAQQCEVVIGGTWTSGRCDLP
jgi:hypothetical protein